MTNEEWINYHIKMEEEAKKKLDNMTDEEEDCLKLQLWYRQKRFSKKYGVKMPFPYHFEFNTKKAKKEFEKEKKEFENKKVCTLL